MERLFSPCTRLHDILESQGRLGEPQAAPAHCFALTMARLFSPCTRLQNHLFEVVRARFAPELFQELNLDVSTEELLIAGRAFTYADLHAMLGDEDTVAWLTPHAAVSIGGISAMDSWDQLNESYRFYFSADGKEIVGLSRSPEHLLEICDIVLRLLAVSIVHSVILKKWNYSDGAFVNAPTLAYLMEQCQSLKVITLKDLILDESHCRVLGDYSRPDLEIVLDRCNVTSAGASALTEVLGRNQGPTKLDFCEIDNVVLANGLCGNSRLKILKLSISTRNLEVGSRQLLAIASAIRENKGLTELTLVCCYFVVNDEAWGAICDSLEAHPTLEVLNFREAFTARVTPAVLISRIQALEDMMKVNISIYTMHLDACYSQHELFRGSVIPYLNTNMFRPRLLAIQKTRPITYRAKVLGSALLSARADANRFWMLLSGNSEVAFSSRTTAAPACYCCHRCCCFRRSVTIAATASLPTAVANADTSAANFSTALVVFSFAPAATAAANVASPSSGQKRKALP
jgi:hypothetical protein